MPIGLAAAVIGSSVIGAGASIIGANKAASAQTKASQQAIAYQRATQGQIRNDLLPYMQGGGTSNNALLGQLGLGPNAVNPNATVGSTPVTAATKATWQKYLQMNPDVQTAWNARKGTAAAMGATSPEQFAQWHYNAYGKNESGRNLPQGIAAAVNPALAQAHAGPTGGILDSPLLASYPGQVPSFTPYGAPPQYQDFKPTQAQLEQTPGYQFNLTQGLKSVQNAAAARGLGVSGAAMKGAANFAKGLADTTYQNQFANYVTGYQNKLQGWGAGQQQNLENYNANLAHFTTGYDAYSQAQQQQYNRLLQEAQLGSNAAAAQGGIAANISGQVGNNIVGIGNARAGAAVGTANAISGGIGNISNLLLTNQLLKSGGGNGLFGSSGTTGGASGWQPWMGG